MRQLDRSDFCYRNTVTEKKKKGKSILMVDNKKGLVSHRGSGVLDGRAEAAGWGQEAAHTSLSFWDQKLPGNLGHAILTAGGGAERPSQPCKHVQGLYTHTSTTFPQIKKNYKAQAKVNGAGRCPPTGSRAEFRSQGGCRAIIGRVYLTGPPAESPNPHHG